MRLKGNIIVPGKVRARTIVSNTSISFLGDVDPENGIIIDKFNPLNGESIVDKCLIFPYGKGSTVGSYILYQLYKNNKAPAAIINKKAEAIVAVGAIISEIPMMDQIQIETLPHNRKIFVNATKGYIEF
jgi:hypothetical protein